MSFAAKPRIALVQQGDPTRAGSWSGVPVGLTSGFRAAGCEVVPVNAEFRGAGRIARHLGMSWAHQATSRSFAAAFSATANRRLRGAGPLDGVVMIGTSYSLSIEAPVVTFEDMTVAQALRQPDSIYGELGPAAAARWKARQQHTYESSHGCCVTSRWVAESLREDYGVPDSKVHVVGLGNNLEVVPAPKHWDVPRFLFVGVDWERKRGPAVLEAFAAVRERFPEATLDLVGGHPRVDAEGVVGHGMLPLGSKEGRRRYARLLNRATCLLMPSAFEPFGIAYLDAGVAGVPSIGTTVGGAEDAVGDCGRVVDPGDPGALLEAMLELADGETARELGERALARSETLSWRAVAERVLAALREPPVEAG
jgi:glycosyltransferase involved in cell wall biosynthesis